MLIYAVGLHVSEKQGSTVRYYHQDHLVSSRLVTDSSGNRAWTRNYEPHGPLSGGSTAERWLYAGKSPNLIPHIRQHHKDMTNNRVIF
jgi:hypothetical protein